MAKKHLRCDRHELVALQIVRDYTRPASYNRPGGFFHRDAVMWKPPKHWKAESASADGIRRIHIGEVTRPLLFGFFRMSDDRITIETTDGRQFSFLRSQEKEYFDEYRRELAAFARENNVTFSDTAPSAAGGR